MTRCMYLGPYSRETTTCPSCRQGTEIKLYECGAYGQCTLEKEAPGFPCCAGRQTNNGLEPCPRYTPLEGEMKPRWAYGVTTVPQRRKTTLPRTLASLRLAGFPQPRLFVDGDTDTVSWRNEFKLPVSSRDRILAYGNWYLGMLEMFIREPNATHYAMFQDDFVTYPNLRLYLESCKYPEDGYWNLYTFPSNEALHDGAYGDGWYMSNQFGRGAVALVFSRMVLMTLLASGHMVERPTHASRGWKVIDGGVVTALAKAGVKEYVHYPSLVQHVGDISTLRNKLHPKSQSFRGEDYDAMRLTGAKS